MTRHAAHLGGVIVVEGADLVRRVLVPVYDALGLDWDPATVGAVADEAPGVDPPIVLDALHDELGGRFDLYETFVAPETLALAEKLLPAYISP